MLSTKGLGSAAQGAGRYYIELAQEDYYTEGGEPAGRWFGQSAASLGLTETVDKEPFLHLMRGFDATGARALVQDAGQDHNAGWDFTFSAPKSVSVLWAMTDDPAVRERIQAAQQAAVEATLRFAERHCAYTRRGHGGLERERVAGLAVATFEHSTSREQDPQLHTHCIVANVAQRHDGTHGSLEGRTFYRWKMALGAIYRAELAHQIETRLPVQIVRDQSSFAIEGVPAAIQQLFSKRAEQIKEWLAENGYAGAAAAQTAALNTRVQKDDIDRSTLLAGWKREGEAAGWGPEQAAGLLAGPSPAQERLSPMNLNDFQEKLVSQQSTFGEREAWRLMAESMQGIGGLGAIEERMQAFWRDPQIVAVGEWRPDQSRWSTAAMVELEKNAMETARRAAMQHRHTLSADTVDATLKARPTLSDEQAAAVRQVCERGGAIALVEGLPGTGKSFMLDTAREAWQAEGYRVIGAAHTGKAALGLQDSAHIPSATIHARLKEWREPRALDAKTVVVVDEAGLIGSRQMADLVKTTQEAGAKLVLVGDHRQLQPIEAGGMFRAMTERIDTAQLTDIRRQDQPWAREAVHAIAEGHAHRAVEAYETRGLIHVAETKQDTVQALVAQWMQAQTDHPDKSRLIIASERADVRAINRQIRDQLHSMGHLGADHTVTTEQGTRTFAAGDRVVFLRNSTPYGVKNGQLGTLEDIAQRGKNTHLRIRLDPDAGGRTVSIPLQRYGHIDHGYAITTHKSQGVTVDDTFVLAGGKMANREIGLVQLSRQRRDARVFVDRSFYQDANRPDHVPDVRYHATRDRATLGGEGATVADRTAAGDYAERAHATAARLSAQLQKSQQKEVTLDYPHSRDRQTPTLE